MTSRELMDQPIMPKAAMCRRCLDRPLPAGLGRRYGMCDLCRRVTETEQDRIIDAFRATERLAEAGMDAAERADRMAEHVTDAAIRRPDQRERRRRLLAGGRVILPPADEERPYGEERLRGIVLLWLGAMAIVIGLMAVGALHPGLLRALGGEP